jgi:hypothetical protein
VPALPVSYIEQRKPQGLWAALTEECQDALPGCDWLAIPHNSNLSGAQGRMFLPENADRSPLTRADAATRAAMEPLVEIYQHKGSSECRPGVDSADEQCGFELLHQFGNRAPRDPNQTFPPLAYVRNALKEGLVQEQRLGANPFRLGFIADTDTHNGSPGYTREDAFYGHSGVNDNSPANGQLRLASPSCGQRRTRATRCLPRCAGARRTEPAARAMSSASSPAHTRRTCVRTRSSPRWAIGTVYRWAPKSARSPGRQVPCLPSWR